jgi:hypothetical protein
MMHDREKSDPATVAGKPTNKAVSTAAESVEPRAGAKGNASQQSTHRTQGRERVSQALERVRQAARQRKKEKFTALLHHVSVDLLGMAFFALKRDAAPGVDGLTWRTYEADLDRNLTARVETNRHLRERRYGQRRGPRAHVLLQHWRSHKSGRASSGTILQSCQTFIRLACVLN